jgi:hypothetical protein
MNALMEPKKPKGSGKKLKNPEQVMIRMDAETQSALEKFIAAQKVPPDRPAVALIALRLFLQAEGFLKPPKPTA